MTREQEKAWLAQWDRAAVALDGVRTRELAQLSAEEALSAIDALLSLASPAHIDSSRLRTSGLVEQQRLFRRHPK